jgi:hypothetical protein
MDYNCKCTNMEYVGSEPSHHLGGYPQRPPLVGLQNSQHIRLCKRYVRRVLQGAEGARGLHADARTDRRHEGVPHRAGEC